MQGTISQVLMQLNYLIDVKDYLTDVKAPIFNTRHVSMRQPLCQYFIYSHTAWITLDEFVCRKYWKVRCSFHRTNHSNNY